MSPESPIRPTDDGARRLARGLIDDARLAALAVLDPGSGAPVVSRVALSTDGAGMPVTLISDLSQHTAALRANPVCSLLVGEPGPKGDPLTHPRLTIQARADFVARGDARHDALRTRYLSTHPKAKLYVDFADFHFVRLVPDAAFLNGGFGKAYRLSAADLAPG